MRVHLELQTNWWVSVSDEDAMAACRPGFSGEELERADDAENHPQCIALPGGPEYGKRPRVAEEERLPAPFLSYARRILVPNAGADHRFFLNLDMTRYNVTVSVNGRVVGQYVGGWEPHRFDVTDDVTQGEVALVLITVGDSGVSGHRVFDPYNYTGTRLPTCVEICDNLVHPVEYGGADRAVGKVWLDAVPAVRTAWVFANPKVSRGELEYSLQLANDSPHERTVRLRSEAKGEDGLTKVLLARDVVLGPGTEQSIHTVVPWTDAVLWDTDTPHLYELHTTLSDASGVVDAHNDRFGFREFSINGHSYYLNGRKIHLHGSSGHSHSSQDAWSLEEKMHFFRRWKEDGHVCHVRLHARPKDKGWVEAADRVGMLITTETALWTTGFHSFDWAGSEEACYQNVRNHFLEGLVRRDRNNPSVVMWSLSNEMSPITEYDMTNPKMAAMTRVFEMIIAEAEVEDDSRVIQMSSALDFVGRLKMLNLHYPKNWQAFPDYPHTAYWLDSSFLFPWYGVGRDKMPAWSWRRDKPLYIGEFTCIFGPTPDSQACIVGDMAFEDADSGTSRVAEKLWPLEINAYRRQDVSGFCAWSAMFGSDLDYEDVEEYLQRPWVAAHSYALRPLALVDHSFRTAYFGGEEVALSLSLHNDTRTARELAVRCEVAGPEGTLWEETMPAAVFGTAENKAWTSRLLAPMVDEKTELRFHALLTSEGETVDEWTKTLCVHPCVAPPLSDGCAFFDPEGTLRGLLKRRGIQGGVFVEDRSALEKPSRFHTLWLNFQEAKLRLDDWCAIRDKVRNFVRDGGCVVLDNPIPAIWQDLPVPLNNGNGFAAGDRLELTYAYNIAPHHPVTGGFSDADFSLWGEDGYIAHRCLETPQSGNVVPLLVAGADLSGLTHSPLQELREGRGSYLVSTLELFSKLSQAPLAGDILRSFAEYRPSREVPAVGICATPESLARYREAGLCEENLDLESALKGDVALLDGDCLTDAAIGALAYPVQDGKTVYLHDLTAEQTRRVLDVFRLPGEVKSGAVRPRENDVFRHGHELADGMTNNYLYWTVGKASLAAWKPATLHPNPTSAVIVMEPSDAAQPLTRRGAVVVYEVGQGRLVIDNLRWQLTDIDEPERPRRYVRCLLTNLGVPLRHSNVGVVGANFETEAERRERGHF